jgi:hypothetical protein
MADMVKRPLLFFALKVLLIVSLCQLKLPD